MALRNKRIERLVTMTALAIYLFSIAAPSLVDGNTTPEPSLTVKLDPSSQEALVTEQDNITLHFTGSVRRDGFPVERSLIGLDTSVDTGWTGSISPGTIVIGDGNDYSFEVSVIVPAAASHEKTGTLVVKAETTIGNITITGKANATINPAAYYKVGLETDKSSFDIHRGGQVFLSVRVRNQGNANDTFEMEIVNLEDLVNEKWTITLSTNQIPRLPPGEYNVRKIVASPDENGYFKGDSTTLIKVKLTSVNAREMGHNVSETIVFTVHVQGDGPISISPYLVIIGLGAVAAYLFRRPGRKPPEKL